jgi:hypothetical protein
MNKASLYNIPDKEKAEIFQQASTMTGMAAHAVEKDWWVVQTLDMVFSLPIGEHIVFKGGTSLSKAWNLIERFSEDVDLALDRKFFGFEGTLNRNQITKLRKSAGAYIDETVVKGLQDQVMERGFDRVTLELVPGERSDRDRTIQLNYPNVIESPGYLPPRVKIEFSCRSLMEPSTAQVFGAVVDKAFPDASFIESPITVPTVNPERTLLEKIFLLHEEFQRPSESIRKGDRLSRHLYDIVKLSESKFAAAAFGNPELYQTIVAHRREFNAVQGVDYGRHGSADLQIVPPDDVAADWKRDYQIMIEEMIYELNPPQYEDLVKSLGKLMEKLKVLKWEVLV